jgi:hypothetical protein
VTASKSKGKKYVSHHYHIVDLQPTKECHVTLYNHHRTQSEEQTHRHIDTKTIFFPHKIKKEGSKQCKKI